MKNRGYAKMLTAAGLIVIMVLSGTGCGNKIYSDPNMTASSQAESIDPMSFTAIDAKFRAYTFGINEYMREHSAEATQKKTDGSTPNGVAASCVYTVSPDSKYESLQMEKTLDNGMQVDEYFNMGDSIFIARTTLYNDGNYEPVDKYYIIDGCLYKIDSLAESVTKITDINTDEGTAVKADIDIYYSFEEIRAIYA